MLELIPFKVKVSQEAIDKFWEEFSARTRMPGAIIMPEDSHLLRHYLGPTGDVKFYKDMLGKYYTVVGYTNGIFLVVRPGEISRWFPQRFMEVADVVSDFI